MSTATDPYLYQEAKYRVTRNVLLQLTNIKCKITILTKSALVCDDIPILKNLNNVTVAFSINTLDSKFQGAMDKAYPINKRLLALRKLHKNKIRTAVFISPIFPYITN
jgi:DNA repair photolyase